MDSLSPKRLRNSVIFQSEIIEKHLQAQLYRVEFLEGLKGNAQRPCTPRTPPETTEAQADSPAETNPAAPICLRPAFKGKAASSALPRRACQAARQKLKSSGAPGLFSHTHSRSG